MHLDALQLPSSTLSRLKALCSTKTSAHLYLFVAPTEQAASTTAKAFLLDWLEAKPTQDVHPDLFELFCSGKAGLHAINRIRELLENIALTPHSSKGRAILIHSAERMLPSASNSLLKVLEEPPPSTMIILATHALQKILPTIISRGQIIRLSASLHQPLLDVQQILDACTYKTIHEFTQTFVTKIEEQKESLEKDLLASHMREDLPASARHELEQDVEATLTLFTHEQSKKLLQEAYLALRASQYQNQQALTLSLLQALKAIERGSDLKRILPIFLSEAIISKQP